MIYIRIRSTRQSREHETRVKRVGYANSDQQGEFNKDSEVERGRATTRKQKHFIVGKSQCSKAGE